MSFCWLKCRPCETVWKTPTAEPCWLCGAPGELTNSPMIIPSNPIDPTRPEEGAA